MTFRTVLGSICSVCLLVAIPNLSTSQTHTFSEAQIDDVICVRKRARVLRPTGRFDRVVLRRMIQVREGECRPRETLLWAGPSGATILARLTEVHGSGSGLDADLLDGHDSSHFGTAAQITEIAQNISLLNTDISIVNDKADTNTQSIVTANQSLDTVTQTVSNQQSALEALGLGSFVIRVGTDNAEYTELEDAIAFVDGQVRDEENRYLILLGAGNYEIASTVALPSFTTLAGSGKHSTRLATANGFVGNHMMTLTFSSSVSDLTIVADTLEVFNFAGNDPSPAVAEDPTSYRTDIARVRVESLAALVGAKRIVDLGGAGNNVGLLIRDSEFVISGGNGSNVAILASSENAPVYLINANISASGASPSTLTQNSNTVTTIERSVLVSAGTGVAISHGSASIQNSRIELTGMTGAALVVRQDADSVSVNGSTLIADLTAVRHEAGSLTVANSTLRAVQIGVDTEGAGVRTVMHGCDIEVTDGGSVGLRVDDAGEVFLSSSRLAANTAAELIAGGSATCRFITNGAGVGFADACGVI